MTRILTLLIALLCGTDAAAQTLSGAFTIPTGNYEYRWRTLVRPDGTIERTAIRGYLRLHANGRFAHQRQTPGLEWSHQSGAFNARGNMLYINNVDGSGGDVVSAMTLQRDTFIVRHPGDRLFLWQNLHGEGKLEYELAPVGAPVQRAPAPDLIPSLYGHVVEIRYFEHGTDTAPPRAQRRFATSFPAATSRWIWAQLQVEWPTAPAAGEVTVECAMHDSAGTEIDRVSWTMPYRAGSTSAYQVYGLGSNGGGFFHADTYRVNCAIDGVQMMEGTFQVT
ncbi:hypothetical protein [Longimicrobium sp.]|uniref:hypothetical protein n=1 Tax=Longimicrobium sp. TaxID=2029185 RepID=UPI003B3B6B77